MGSIARFSDRRQNYEFRQDFQAYEDIERQSLNEADDPHLVISVLFKELLKSMTLFVDNIDLKSGGDLNVKSKHFARSLTIIYGLQSSLDFEKGGPIAENLFQLYEFARQKLIDDLGSGKAEGTLHAINLLSEIKSAWDEIGKDNVKEQ